ncbi:hypothetical protein JCM8547_004984 [Rhodosporidiobolus lusitaniae]
MSAATPTRRSSYALSTVPELTSPPPSFSRRASAVSAASSTGSPSHTERKRRNRNLLRDYYGLANTASKAEQLDIDSPSSFNPDAYFASLTSTASLPDLLTRENELLNEIRELDGERQSLVYNHHHELIDASATIRKMKSRAEALDTSLDALKTSFQSISQLSASLAPPSSTTPASPRTSPRPPSSFSSSPQPPETPHRRKLSAVNEAPDSPTTPTANRPRASSSATVVHHPHPPAEGSHFDPLVHLPALLSLPILLRAFLAPPPLSTSSTSSTPGGTNETQAEGRKKADALWGTWEPALRSWEDEGVEGVKEIGQECREVLRMARRGSVSVAGRGE